MTLDEHDRLAAEKVMGWKLGRDAHNWMDASGKMTDFDDGIPQYGSGIWWQPTRNIAQAWKMLEKFKCFREIKYHCGEERWCCAIEIEGNGDKYGSAETAPLAIVRACLAARGVVVSPIAEERK